MKKILIIGCLAILLAACLPVQTTQDSDAEIATRVAQILTTFPTWTPQPTNEPTSTSQPTSTLQPPTATSEVTNTPVVVDATATVTLNSTQAVAATQTAAVVLPTATLQVGDPRSTLGAPTWTDLMDKSDNWPTGTNTFTSIAFGNGELELTALTEVSGWRLNGTSLTNAYIEMTGKLESCSGLDRYGIIFRVPILNDADQGYLFGITCDGQYYLLSYDGKIGVNGTTTGLVWYTSNAAIVAGANKTNRIGVLFKGTSIKLYANGVLLKEITDSTFSKGYFGIFVRKEVTDKLKAKITEMDYWVIQ